MMKKSTLSLPKLRCPKCGMWLGKDNLESVFVYCPQCRISYFEFELKEMLFKTKGGESMPVVNIPEEYLDARMVKTGDIITIAGPHIEKSAEETPFGRPTIEVPVILPNGTRVNYTINKTSLKRIMEAYGNNSDYWVGKKLKIELIKQNVRGQIKDVIQLQKRKKQLKHRQQKQHRLNKKHKQLKLKLKLKKLINR